MQIKTTNAATGEVSFLVVNESLSVGDTFRLIGRSAPFRAVDVFDHKVAGPCVRGVSLDGKFATNARVADTCTA